MVASSHANGDRRVVARPPGVVFWITGLSGAGKTTVAASLSALLDEAGRPHVRLDGDELRAAFGDVGGYDRASRLALAQRYGRFCRLIAGQGLDVLCSTISLFREVHQWNRENIERYFEIFLDVDLETLRRRDIKGIYRRSGQAGKGNVAGLDIPVDLPDAPDLTIRNDGGEDPQALARAILQAEAARSPGPAR